MEECLEKLKTHLIEKLENTAENPKTPISKTLLKHDFYVGKSEEIAERAKSEEVRKIFIDEISKCKDFDEIVTILAILFEMAFKSYVNKYFFVIPKDQAFIVPVTVDFDDEDYGGEGIAF